MYATCETQGCPSLGASIPVFGQYAVVCGVCGNEITKLTDAPQDEITEMPSWEL